MRTSRANWEFSYVRAHKEQYSSEEMTHQRHAQIQIGRAHKLPFYSPSLRAGARLLAALHPDYIQRLQISVDGVPVVPEWQADVLREGELQEIPGLEGFGASRIQLEGLMEPGEYLGILEVSVSANASLEGSEERA